MPIFKIAESALPSLQTRLKRLAAATKKETGQRPPGAAAPLYGLQIVQGWWMLVDGDGTVRVRIFDKKIEQEIWGAATADADADDAKIRATETFVLLMTRCASLEMSYSADVCGDKAPWRTPTSAQEIDDMLREIGVHMVFNQVRVSCCEPASRGALVWVDPDEPGSSNFADATDPPPIPPPHPTGPGHGCLPDQGAPHAPGHGADGAGRAAGPPQGDVRQGPPAGDRRECRPSSQTTRAPPGRCWVRGFRRALAGTVP